MLSTNKQLGFVLYSCKVGWRLSSCAIYRIQGLSEDITSSLRIKDRPLSIAVCMCVGKFASSSNRLGARSLIPNSIELHLGTAKVAAQLAWELGAFKNLASSRSNLRLPRLSLRLFMGNILVSKIWNLYQPWTWSRLIHTFQNGSAISGRWPEPSFYIVVPLFNATYVIAQFYHFFYLRPHLRNLKVYLALFMRL